MKNLITLSLILLSTSSLATVYTGHCKTVLDPNISHSSYITINTADLSFVIDTDQKNAHIDGIADITSQNGRIRDYQISNYTDQIRTKVSSKDDLITVKSHEKSSWLLCGGQEICHEWLDLTLDTKTNELLFKHASTTDPLGRKRTVFFNTRLKCELN